MSGIAGLYNIPGNDPDLNTWAFVHAAHHTDINRIIYQLVGTNLTSSLLDPFDIHAPDEWLINHQNMHREMDALLGIAGYNLLAVDFGDKGQFSNWIFLNADEHIKAANILGLG